MKKISKNVKGMSLIEIIISMVVFAVTALILVQVGGTINSLVKRSNHINKKTTIEAPYIENADACLNVTRNAYYANKTAMTGRDYTKDSETIDIVNNSLEAYSDPGSSDKASPIRVSLEYKGTKVTLNAACFSARPSVADPADSSKERSDLETGSNLKYMYISTWLTSGGNAIWVDNHPVDKDGNEIKKDEGSDGDTDSDKVNVNLPDDQTVNGN